MDVLTLIFWAQVIQILLIIGLYLEVPYYAKNGHNSVDRPRNNRK